MTVYKAAASEYTASCKVTVSVPTLCWCNRWPDYGGFWADGYLWALPREFPHVGVAKTVLEMPQNTGRSCQTEKKRVIFGHFWRGWPTRGSILGGQTASD